MPKPKGRDRPELTEIEVTPEMIEAGVQHLREFLLGGDLSALARWVYISMECERRSNQDGEQ
jgi:hypothetical protein